MKPTKEQIEAYRAMAQSSNDTMEKKIRADLEKNCQKFKGHEDLMERCIKYLTECAREILNSKNGEVSDETCFRICRDYFNDEIWKLEDQEEKEKAEAQRKAEEKRKRTEALKKSQLSLFGDTKTEEPEEDPEDEECEEDTEDEEAMDENDEWTGAKDAEEEKPAPEKFPTCPNCKRQFTHLWMNGLCFDCYQKEEKEKKAKELPQLDMFATMEA